MEDKIDSVNSFNKHDNQFSEKLAKCFKAYDCEVELMTEDNSELNLTIHYSHNTVEDAPEWKKNLTFKVERDYDYKTTNNLYVEEFYSIEPKKIGWIYHTRAAILAVYYTKGKFFLVNLGLIKYYFFNPTHHTHRKHDIHYKHDYVVTWSPKSVRHTVEEKIFTTYKWKTPLEEDDKVFNPIFNKVPCPDELEEWLRETWKSRKRLF